MKCKRPGSVLHGTGVCKSTLNMKESLCTKQTDLHAGHLRTQQRWHRSTLAQAVIVVFWYRTFFQCNAKRGLHNETVAARDSFSVLSCKGSAFQCKGRMKKVNAEKPREFFKVNIHEAGRPTRLLEPYAPTDELEKLIASQSQ